MPLSPRLALLATWGVDSGRVFSAATRSMLWSFLHFSALTQTPELALPHPRRYLSFASNMGGKRHKGIGYNRAMKTVKLDRHRHLKFSENDNAKEGELPYLSALIPFREAARRRGQTFKHLFASRMFTSLPGLPPEDELKAFPTVIHCPPGGTPRVNPAIDAEIERARQEALRVSRSN